MFGSLSETGSPTEGQSASTSESSSGSSSSEEDSSEDSNAKEPPAESEGPQEVRPPDVSDVGKESLPQKDSSTEGQSPPTGESSSPSSSFKEVPSEDSNAKELPAESGDTEKKHSDSESIPIFQLPQKRPLSGKTLPVRKRYNLALEVPTAQPYDAANSGSGIASRLRPRRKRKRVPTFAATPIQIDTEGDSEPDGVEEVSLPRLPGDVQPQLVDFVAKESWNTFQIKKIILELPICEEEYGKADLLSLLDRLNLLQSAQFCAIFHPLIVYEFYSNLKKSICNPISPCYHKVWVRGHLYDFSPEIINTFFGVPPVEEPEIQTDYDAIVSELTGGYRKKWYKTFSPAVLTNKYYALYKVAVSHWRPTLHYSPILKSLAFLIYKIGKEVPINLGQLIFSQVAQFAEHPKHTASLMFPSMIYCILQSQKEIPISVGPLFVKFPTLKFSSRKVFVRLDTSNDFEAEARPSPPKLTRAHIEHQHAYYLGRLEAIESEILMHEKLLTLRNHERRQLKTLLANQPNCLGSSDDKVPDDIDVSS